MTKIQCKIHGAGPETFVCQHIVEGLLKRERVGFFWANDDLESPYPDAWCAACEVRVRAAGGDWTGEALEHLRPRLLCGHCYEAAKAFHTGGDPWS